MSRSGAVRLIPMIGKAEKVSRQTWRLAVVGICPASWASRPWTNINDWIMSTFQSKKTLISAEPRLVAERIDSIPILEALDDLDAVPLANPRRHFLDVGDGVSVDHGDRALAPGLRERDGGDRHHQRRVVPGGDDARPAEHPRTHRASRVGHGDADGRRAAARIERRRDQPDLPDPVGVVWTRTVDFRLLAHVEASQLRCGHHAG